MTANIKFARSFIHIEKNTRRFSLDFPTFFLLSKGDTVLLKPDNFSWRFHLTKEGRKTLDRIVTRQKNLIKLLNEESSPNTIWVLLKHTKEEVIQTDGSMKIYFNPYTEV